MVVKSFERKEGMTIDERDWEIHRCKELPKKWRETGVIRLALCLWQPSDALVEQLVHRQKPSEH